VGLSSTAHPLRVRSDGGPRPFSIELSLLQRNEPQLNTTNPEIRT
jgi:hypothetical protein